MQTKALGLQGADTALRNTKGREANAVDPPSVLFGPAAYDSRELERWGISEADCRRAALCTFVSRLSGISIAGPSSPSRRSSVTVDPDQLRSVSGSTRREAEAEAALQRQELAHLMRVAVLANSPVRSRTRSISR